MTTTRHTPGPWHCGIWDGDQDTIEIYAVEKTAVGSDKIDIATINQNEATVLEEWQIANARLIASAPELLNACAGMLLQVRLILKGNQGRPDLADIMKQAEAAITKAKGGAI